MKNFSGALPYVDLKLLFFLHFLIQKLQVFLELR